LEEYAFMRSQTLTQAVTRRDFLRTVAVLGTATGGAGLLAACQQLPDDLSPHVDPLTVVAPSPQSAASQPTEENQVARVAFIKTDNRAEGVRRAMTLLGPLDTAGRSILIKPNFNSDDPAPGSTHPDVLQIVLDEVRQSRPEAITIADRSGMGTTRQVMDRLGVLEMAEAAGADVTVLDDLAREGWELVQLPNSHWQQGFPMARCCLDADVVIQLCCLKTHRFGGHFTLSLKNSVGLVAKYLPGDPYNYMRELHSSPHQRKMIAEINAAYAPDLVIVDGVEAFVRGGPASGERVAANAVLAGTDRVALDAVGVALLRYFGTTPEVSAGPIFAQEQIARAVELGLGVGGPQQIELLTDDAGSEAYAADIRSILMEG
jgi:uncharacterized protein (DUF362 family)